MITGPSFSAGILRDRLPGSAPISLQWFNLCLSFSNICKATTVTHTKRTDRNLLRKETSFVCYTSSVLIQIESLEITHVRDFISSGNNARARWRNAREKPSD